MNTRVRARVNKIIRALKAYDPERVILFGSAARGDGDQYSDIDIAVIKETSERFLDRLARVYDLIKPDFALDVLVYTPNEFAEMRDAGNSFVEEILRDGMIVYDRAKKIARESRQPPYSSPGMRKQQAEREGRRWMEQARYDLRAAQTNAEHNLYSYACFIAQQAAEKALKAFLYHVGKRDVRGHSVSELCRRVTRIQPEFSEIEALGSKLDRFYIPTRYPNGLPGDIPGEAYDCQDAAQAIDLARQVIDTVSKYLNV